MAMSCAKCEEQKAIAARRQVEAAPKASFIIKFPSSITALSCLPPLMRMSNLLVLGPARMEPNASTPRFTIVGTVIVPTRKPAASRAFTAKLPTGIVTTEIIGFGDATTALTAETAVTAANAEETFLVNSARST